MKMFKNWWVFSAILFLLACSTSAKTEKKEEQNAQGEVKVLNKATFLDKVYNYEQNPDTWVYKGDKPCIIDFYADWCGPCKKVAPILKEMAGKYKDQLVVYKINVDEETALAQAFNIKSIPTILFVPLKGKPLLVQGAMPRDEVIKQIESYLLKKN